MLAVRSWNLVVFLSTIAIITFIGICLLAAWLVWEMQKAKGFLDEIRTMHARSAVVAEDVEKDWYQRCWDLMALLGNQTKEDIKNEIKLKEVVDAWQLKMKNKKDKKGKKSGTAEGQEKKEKKRTGKGQEKDKKSATLHV